MPRPDHPPAFLFYTDDFCSDAKVEAMTTEEVGAYILLLCKSWRENPPGSIPNDDCVLARWARLTPDRWSECRTGVLAAFILGTDSRWHQKRLRQEYEKLQGVRKERKDAANKRWLEEKRKRDANALQMQSIPFPSSSKEKKEHPPPKSATCGNVEKCEPQNQNGAEVRAENTLSVSDKGKGQSQKQKLVPLFGKMVTKEEYRRYVLTLEGDEDARRKAQARGERVSGGEIQTRGTGVPRAVDKNATGAAESIAHNPRPNIVKRISRILSAAVENGAKPIRAERISDAEIERRKAEQKRRLDEHLQKAAGQ